VGRSTAFASGRPAERQEWVLVPARGFELTDQVALLERLSARRATIVVVGQGYVGLGPSAGDARQ
jgi:hypothetical protein